jgi:oligopeptide transport system ATP-binding protein
LDVRNLEVSFHVRDGVVHAVRGLSLRLRRGECLCIMGESGCGKSSAVQALTGLLPMPPARIDGGEAAFSCGIDLIRSSVRQRRAILGKEIGIIFQDPLTSLNPTMTVYRQIAEILLAHTRLDRRTRHRRILEILELVGIPEPEKRLQSYPHELSGGMRQRLMIAIALICNPKLLIADEPTSALDASIQAQVLALIKQLAQTFEMATLLITHDPGVVAQMADRVAVMYAGKIVEEGSVDQIFHSPKHPYTIALQRAIPKDSSREPLEYIPGTPPDLFAPPPGCGFAARCGSAMRICHLAQPEEIEIGHGRVSCWRHHRLWERFRDSGIPRVAQERAARASI